MAKLRTEVELELEQIQRLLSDYRTQINQADSKDLRHETVIVLASALHSFYNGAENALKRMLLEIDGEIPSGPASHSDLLRQAAAVRGGRPPLISTELQQTLIPYMAYRHFFRHAYSFQMDWEHMQDLVIGFPATANRLQAELISFLDLMEMS